MRVRLNTSYAIGTTRHPAGAVVDLDAAVARRLLGFGMAATVVGDPTPDPSPLRGEGSDGDEGADREADEHGQTRTGAAQSKSGKRRK